MALQDDFNAAVIRSKELTKRPSNEELLDLYALFKQATEGDISGDRPGGFDFKAIAKYDAWASRKGVTKEQAMRDYIGLVTKLHQNYAWSLNLFYQPEILKGIHHLDEEESRHAVKVLRMKAGDALHITDGSGSFYHATITVADSRKCMFSIVEKKSVPKRKFLISLAIAPTKNIDRTEWFVEKSVEYGIEQIHFMRCQNSERKTVNMDRIEKIVISAMKQSGQAWLPVCTPIKPFPEVLVTPADQKFICHVDHQNPDQLKSLAAPGKNYIVLIGPEGDFRDEELKQAIDHGFIKVSLGHNRLRTETAALAACHTLNLINL